MTEIGAEVRVLIGAQTLPNLVKILTTVPVSSMALGAWRGGRKGNNRICSLSQTARTDLATKLHQRAKVEEETNIRR